MPPLNLPASLAHIVVCSQVQTIGFLSFLKSKGIHGPFMIVAPLSTLPNWVNEFQRFLPSCPPLLYHGSKQEREAMRATQLRLDRECGPGGCVGVYETHV